LVNQYQIGNQDAVFNHYINNIHAVNNWDLVDTTTPQIVGDYLYISLSIQPIALWIKSCLSPNNNLAILNVGVNSPRLIKVRN
jgi:3-methyladenine DNA glycosylase AlkD